MGMKGLIKKGLPQYSAGRKVFLISVMTGIGIVLFVTSFKNVALDRGLDRTVSKCASAGYRLTWKEVRFHHFNRILVSKLLLESETDSSQIRIDSLAMKFSIFPALRGRLAVRELACTTIWAFIDAKKSPGDSIHDHGHRYPSPESNYSLLANRILHRLFISVPRRFETDTVKIIIQGDAGDLLLTFHNSAINRGNIRSLFYCGGETEPYAVLLEGRINHKKLYAELIAHSPFQKSCSLSFPGNNTILAGFDSLKISLSFPHYSNKMVTLSGTAASRNLTVEGKQLSLNPISIDHFLSSFVLHITPLSVELDSASAVTVNRIHLHPYAIVTRDPELKLKLKICPATWDAEDFFRSVPDGLFTSLTGFEASGDLHFFLDFSLDMKSIDSLYFSSKLSSGNFKILHFGNDDYRLLNTEFMHHVCEKGYEVASFPVGLINPDFTALSDISPWLKISVLTSEDGGFYFHNGFNLDAIRESIIADIREGRFVRGGSTISMQLVKNVFLTQNKTLGRKLEELLIVWIIENSHLSTKDRMFEVYLNVIEWGPGIYGITQAARYYFNKSPSELTLQESLFLAGIVPFPRRFKSVFESNGCLKSWFVSYMQRMKELMVARNRILPSDTSGVEPQIYLTGQASQVFNTADTVKVDTLRPMHFLFLL
jgi:hypothetical protein